MTLPKLDFRLSARSDNCEPMGVSILYVILPLYVQTLAKTSCDKLHPCGMVFTILLLFQTQTDMSAMQLKALESGASSEAAEKDQRIDELNRVGLKQN